MSTTQRLQKALDKLEIRRIELERQIVAELDRKFFSQQDPDIIAIEGHIPGRPSYASIFDNDNGETGCGSQFTMTWIETA